MILVAEIREGTLSSQSVSTLRHKLKLVKDPWDVNTNMFSKF